MKRSEFAKIVNDVSDESFKKLTEDIKQAQESDPQKLASMLAEIIASIPLVSARTTAEILVRSGVVSLEDD